MMKTLRFTLVGLVISIAAILAGAGWAINPIWRWPITFAGGRDEAETIRMVFPVHIINPTWIHDQRKEYVEWAWKVAETKARLVLLLVGWFAALIVDFRWAVGGLAAINPVQRTRADARAADL